MSENLSTEKVIIDEVAIRKTCMGDEELLLDICSTILNDLPVHIDSIYDSIERREGKLLASHSHKFNGSIKYFYAHRVSSVLKELESMGSSGKFDEVDMLFDKLKEEAGIFKASVIEFQKKLL
ncbi:hypothetical protein A9Q84_15975 [Halobacteriovorax marinus]|uniref:HPt domain-containing protein n=1 Tax=Halobacteriovorax marinus TaxID=97084 RepID=A0A1Y5F4D8_9BACT|nr:hypothetical protein A9Q84_15975 [Halobacteriovorax marinus]